MNAWVVVAWREPGLVHETRGIVKRRDGESDLLLVVSAKVRRIVSQHDTEAEAQAALDQWAAGKEAGL